jgi:HSP20 family protein
MDLKLWTPFMDLDREWRFDFPRFNRDLFGFGFRPAIDLVRDDGELVLTAELPGIDPDDIDVSIDGDVLTIKGEKTEETTISEDDRYLHERVYGTFQRRIPLPSGVSPDKMHASYDKGVLTVRVTLPEERKPLARSIPVEVKS